MHIHGLSSRVLDDADLEVVTLPKQANCKSRSMSEPLSGKFGPSGKRRETWLTIDHVGVALSVRLVRIKSKMMTPSRKKMLVRVFAEPTWNHETRTQHAIRNTALAFPDAAS